MLFRSPSLSKTLSLSLCLYLQFNSFSLLPFFSHRPFPFLSPSPAIFISLSSRSLPSLSSSGRPCLCLFFNSLSATAISAAVHGSRLRSCRDLQCRGLGGWAIDHQRQSLSAALHGSSIAISLLEMSELEESGMSPDLSYSTRIRSQIRLRSSSRSSAHRPADLVPIQCWSPR
ncbi:hypothetical protein TIFTF001_032929 [Ficus carica]|uniref:Uncharacterized protein n=1 Tax=Ficus carica TaxID=3494 RepID=A0AA88DX98_FICCA|nr:hypothetical protein TIFTF001_032929 [Ficus carica]